MYNRYVPGTNGIYERTTIAEKQPQSKCTAPIEEIPPPMPQKAVPHTTGASSMPDFDTGDLLLLCIMLLLLLDGSEDDLSSILITAAAFLFLH